MQNDNPRGDDCFVLQPPGLVGVALALKLTGTRDCGSLLSLLVVWLCFFVLIVFFPSEIWLQVSLGLLPCGLLRLPWQFYWGWGEILEKNSDWLSSGPLPLLTPMAMVRKMGGSDWLRPRHMLNPVIRRGACSRGYAGQASYLTAISIQLTEALCGLEPQACLWDRC